jgi:type VI secretion system protein ImpG
VKRDYFQEEMRYLLEAGSAYAAAHPEQARLLDLASITDRDPYVERLFEGFAFLTGRIHERLDDELPEYAQGLTALLWPHLLKPMPALAILEFDPIQGLIQKRTVVKRGTRVESVPVGEAMENCRFATTQDVELLPMRIADVALAWPTDGTSTATLRLRADRGADFARLGLDRLRLYLHGDGDLPATMHQFFTRHVDGISLRVPDRGDASELTGQQWSRPVAFGASAGATGDDVDGLIPYSRYVFSGHRLLQEYLAFRPRFSFVELVGLDRLALPEGTTELELKVHFHRAYPEKLRFSKQHVRLYCTPIVNLFEGTAQPIRVDHARYEYRVVAGNSPKSSLEVYDVVQVTGREERTGIRHEYAPFFALQDQGAGRCFSVRSQQSPKQALHTLLTLRGLDNVAELSPEVLTVELLCTNGNLPHEKVGEGRITQPAGDWPRQATFKNITRPTTQLYPPTERVRNLYWKLLTHMTFSHRSLVEPGALVSLLDLYDWTEGTDRQSNLRRLRGIRSVNWKARDYPQGRSNVRGGELHVVVDDNHFNNEADLCLFGLVLSRFLTAYATLNSFVHLVLEVAPSGLRYEWRPERGCQPVL